MTVEVEQARAENWHLASPSRDRDLRSIEDMVSGPADLLEPLQPPQVLRQPSPADPRWRHRLAEIVDYAKATPEDQTPIHEAARARFTQLIENLEESGADIAPLAIFPTPEGFLELQIMRGDLARVLEIHPDGYSIREIDGRGRRHYQITTWRVAAELLTA